jgi:hypothetical protein
VRPFSAATPIRPAKLKKDAPRPLIKTTEGEVR